MFKVKKKTELFNQRLAFLGSEYTSKVIDGEHVIYRRFENGIEFEISGVNNSRKSLCICIFVWDANAIVESWRHIKAMPDLKRILETLSRKYVRRPVQMEYRTSYLSRLALSPRRALRVAN